MKVVLDSNVIISAFATRGLCHEIFELCLAEHEIVLSEPMLHEISKTLHGKFHVPQTILEEIKSFLKNEVEMVVPEDIPEDACRDQSDCVVLGTAFVGGAQVLVTGDRDLLILKKFRFIAIFSPRNFLTLLQKTSSK